MSKRLGVCLRSAVLIGLSVSPTGAVHSADDVTGRWAGYFDSVSNPGFQGALAIQISSQNGRRFAGEMCLPPGPCTPVRGTISESGEITMTGRSSQVRSIELHGSPLDGHTGIDRPIVGNYRIMLTDGSSDHGNAVAVHQTAESDVPSDLAGTWGGQATPQGTAAARPVEVMFEIDRTGAVTGRLAWATLDLRSGIVGQTTRANNSGEIAMVGLLDDAIVVVDLGPSAASIGDARRLEGPYRLIAGGVGHEWSEAGFLTLALDIHLAAAKQSEARANLKALYSVEQAYFQEKDVYSTKVNAVGFSPERNNRYRYVLTANPMSLEDRSGPFLAGSFTDEGIDVDTFKYPQNQYPTITQGPCVGTPAWGVTQAQLKHIFTGAAYGDVDGDGTLDVWTISTVARWLSGSQCDAVGFVPAGEPANEVNDVNK